jgi:hypothetical protein
MNFRRLTSDADLARYAAECDRRIHVSFPHEYLDRSHVYGLFDHDGVMVGGALFCVQGPFRAIEGIPQPFRTFAEARLPASVFEGSGLWLDRSVRTPAACLFYYCSLWVAAVRTKKWHGLFTFSKKVRVLSDVYGLGTPPVIYEGPVHCAGMSTADEERVCTSSMIGGSLLFLLSPLLAPAWFARRMLRRSVKRQALAAAPEISR